VQARVRDRYRPLLLTHSTPRTDRTAPAHIGLVPTRTEPPVKRTGSVS
jgi:hypothetical protein